MRNARVVVALALSLSVAPVVILAVVTVLVGPGGATVSDRVRDCVGSYETGQSDENGHIVMRPCWATPAP